MNAIQHLLAAAPLAVTRARPGRSGALAGRVPAPVRDELRLQAAASGVSLSTYLVDLLTTVAMYGPPRLPPPEPGGHAAETGALPPAAPVVVPLFDGVRRRAPSARP